MDGLEHVSLGDPAVPLERAPQTARERLEALHTRATLSRLEVHTLRATERERWTARDEGERAKEKRESEIARARQGNGCVERRYGWASAATLGDLYAFSTAK